MMWDSPSPRENKTIKHKLQVLLVILLGGYLTFPFIFRYSTYVKSNLTFLQFMKISHHTNLRRPVDKGLIGARNFYLDTADGASLGVWHSLPSELQTQAAALELDDPYDTKTLAAYNQWLHNSTVFLYFHGTGGTRASHGRIKLYHLLNQLGYHVITFDYRGYGDSSSEPKTEGDVILDAETVYSWVKKHVHDGHIFFWGHSLGTGVMSHLLWNLERRSERLVRAAVLESSFNNLADALRTYPVSRPYSSMPGFEFFGIDSLAKQNLTFHSDLYLPSVSLPLLFLHAKDDKVVPYRLGHKLYQDVLSIRRDKSSVNFVSYDKRLGYGHSKIYKDPHLPTMIRNFVESSIQRTDLQ